MSVNFRSKLHIALLKYYFENPGAERYLRELSRILSFGSSYLSRELRKFVRDGLFLARSAGKEKYFRINRKYKFYHELRKIVEEI